MSKDIDMYEAFYRTFIAEMPQRTPGGNDFAAQLEMLQENLSYNPVVTAVSKTIFKTVNEDQITYWVGNKKATSVSIIVDTAIFGNFCKVVLSSKHPQIPNKTPPFASDLYLIIKDDIKPSRLTFRSDETLSGDGERLWAGLVRRGNVVSVYDTTQHQYVLSYVSDEHELEQYLGGADKNRYVFVLSESLLLSREIVTTFGLMEIKRKAQWPLFEHLVKEVST